MAQEQAKSPPGTAATGTKDTSHNPLEAMTRSRDEKPGSASSGERTPDLPKRTSLAERLKAEQRKREGGSEAKREEPAKAPQDAAPKPPLEFTEPQAQSASASAAAAPPRQFVRTRRPAGPPPQRRLSAPANDDFPSIGGLIFALQQRPSRTPFLVALGASIAWFLIGGFFAFGLISNQVSAGGLSGLLGSTSALTASLALIVPIVIFWFLALLVWRAQELRLMASAMTEVAVRLAEPDRLAEQSVASVGQTIRRQVAAMNDAISRAIGRASELEAMVHSEVAALERSYGENEHRVRSLISELVTERQALANNSERVSEALKGVGAQIARDITAASASIDKKLAERGVQLTELLVSRSSEAAEQVHKAQARVADAVPALIERLSKEQGRLTEVIEGASHNLVALEGAIAQRTTALDKTSEKLQASLAARIEGLENSVAQGALLLDKTLKDRTDAFTGLLSQGAVLFDNTLKQRTDALTMAIAEGAGTLDQSMKDRTEAFRVTIAEGAGTLDHSIKERTEAFTNLVAQGAVLFDNTLKQRTEALTVAIGEGAGALDKALKDRTGYFNAMIDEKAALMDRQLHDRTGQFLTAINHGAIALDRTLAERAETFTNSLFQRVKALENAIGQQTATLDRTMTERAQAVIVALAERLQAIDSTFNQRTAETDRMLGEHARATAETFGKQTAQLNQVLANNSAIIQQTANQVGAQSREAVSVLTSQTQTLREVSRGLLEQIHGLTQRFENQGQAILTAAKALDSSNTKIDSILEGRHQSIISLLHTVNTKAQDLDNMMRSYAGMVENAMSQAEARAKQVGTALARDTSGQAQAALAQIERLREEAQAHTARAVNDLKGSFETVITQIGRQLEQMRGQFDNTSRGMREAAQQTATDLESLRQEMARRMEALPEHTAQATAAIRKALSEQLREIEAITPVLNRPLPQAPAPEPYRPAQAPSPAQGQFGAGQPFPQFDARGRQMAQPEGGDIGKVAGGLAQQLAGASYAPRQAAQQGAPWSPSQGLAPAAPPAQGGGQLRLDEIARAVDYRTATEIWQRFRSGERGVLGRHIYNQDGQATFDEISRRYAQENEFRVTVDRYIADFERLLGEAETRDPAGSMLQNYLTSESGRVYLLLAHASGRLR
jgi:DNA anti-recombination protein RmuC